ncbi:SIMPL domain-containing protein [Candidatus Gottesmanbacteria bacterium]|nr:SIMPL domain-containing protein [Candidatus Gottesmanbacteria bacterium]
MNVKDLNLAEKLLSYFTFFFAIFLILIIIKTFDVSYPITITTTTKSTELAVVGEGKVDAVPDTVYIDAGIAVSNAATTEAAQQTLTTVNNKIIAAMKSLGIDTQNIKTTNYSVYPNYVYENNQNRISGYNGNAMLTIKVGDPDLATKVVDEATKAGANQIQGTRFVIDKPEKYRKLARDKAIANAREQAQQLASSLGIRLGKITNIVEVSPNGIVLPYQSARYAAEAGGGGGPSFEPGVQTITSTVTLYFEKN